MKPFLSGRTQVSASTLSAMTSATTATGPQGSNASGHKHGSPAAAGAGSGPSVECIKQGDKVVRLIVTCSCGERIEVECLYPAGG